MYVTKTSAAQFFFLANEEIRGEMLFSERATLYLSVQVRPVALRRDFMFLQACCYTDCKDFREQNFRDLFELLCQNHC